MTKKIRPVLPVPVIFRCLLAFLDRQRRSLPSAALVRSLRDAIRDLRQGLSEFLAGADLEFWEHLAQVVFDGARADEQLRADLGVRLPIGG